MNFVRGLKDGLPIALGYMPVAFAYAIRAISQGFPAWFPILISATNFTGTGQVAGTDLIAAGANIGLLFATMLIINIRYTLMSVSIAQKLEPNFSLWKRAVISFGVTDENYWVLEMGTEGAAIATILGQTITAVEAIAYLLWKKLPFFGSLAKFGSCAISVARVGIAPFGLTLSPMISLMLINRFCMLYEGEAAVACYACIAYAITIVQMLLQGVGDGSQPLISQYFGEGKPELGHKVKKLAYICALILAILCCLLLFVLRSFIGPLFGSSESVSREVERVLPIFLIGLIFYAFSRITTATFYATERTIFSYICVYSEPALMLALLFILPLFWGQAGVWWSAVLSQILTAGIALFLFLFSLKRHHFPVK